jgi:ABC-type multidrug transport system ATPase subunit
MDAKKEIEEINNIDSFIKFFKKNINFIDIAIEKLLSDVFIEDDDLDNNDKKMIKIFIHIMKKSEFREIKLLFMLIFIKKLKGAFDNIQSDGNRNNFYYATIKKIAIFFINMTAEKYYISEIKEEECDAIETLLKTFSEKFNSKMTCYILKKVEKIQDNDNSIKYIYQNSYKSILIAYSKFMKVIMDYIKIMVLVINVYLVTIINNEFSFKVFLKTTAINVFYLLNFKITYKRCKINIKNENSNIESTIDEFFNNLPIIIEKNTILEEMIKTSKMIFENITSGGIDEKYRIKSLSNSLIKKSRIYNLYETISSILINNRLLLTSSDSFRSCFEHFSSDMLEFKISLKNTNGFIEVINVKPYKVSNTIQWNKNDNYEHLFVLENIKLQYEYKDQKGDTVISKIVENVNINFEYGLSHIFIGNSGCGKTTILNAIMKRMKNTNGVIKFLGIHDDYTYYSIRKYLTYLTSESALFCKDIYFNIVYGLHKKVVNKNKDNIMQTIIKYMKLFKLEEYIENIKTKNACELSKGQTQKVAIIRLFINIIFNDVRILFLDEITSNIDDKVEASIYTELRNIQKIYRFTMFFVSHNMANIIYSDYTYQINLYESTIYKNKTDINYRPQQDSNL